VDSNTVLSSVNGKIAVVPRNLLGFGSQQWAVIVQTNGAFGFIQIQTPATAFPDVAGTGGLTNQITIPVLRVSGYKTDPDLWNTPGLTASIGASQAVELGGADYGKGMGWINFKVTVPQAGIYPMNLIWYNGGGGAGLEFASYQTNGTRVLVNDSSNPNSLKAYQAVTAGPSNPTVSISHSGSTVTITYTGILLSSPTVDGTYTPVQGATSPYPVNTGAAAAQFYRTR